jgi:hypothetical protein
MRSPLNTISSVSAAILEAVPESGMPSGHLYAALLGHMNLHQYNSIIGALVSVQAFEETSYFLRRGVNYSTLLERMTKLASASAISES